MPSLQVAVVEISSALESNSVADVIMVVWNLSSCKAAGVNAIWPEMLKALDKLEVVWLNFFFGDLRQYFWTGTIPYF